GVWRGARAARGHAMSDIELEIQPTPSIALTIATGQGPAGPQPPLSAALPQPLGVASAGDATEASAGNHVHEHGNQPGGTLHALAGAAAGFMSPAQVTKLAGIEAGAQANVVTSVFGRAGAVTAALADYTAALVTHAIAGLGSTVNDALVTLYATLTALALTVAAKIGFADLTATNAAQLAAVGAPEGTRIFVLTFRDSFVASNRVSPRAVDGAEVIAHASGGNWRWERLNTPHPSWAYQDQVYINASTGSDENDATSGAPIKTNAELVRRLGLTYRPKLALQTIFATGTLDPLIWNIVTEPNNTAIIHYRGTLTAQTTTTISSVVNHSAAANTDASFHGDTGWTSAAQTNRLVLDNTGLGTWVDEQGGGLSGGASDSIVCPWFSDFVTNLGITTAGTSNTANGRTITSYTPGTTLAQATVLVSGSQANFSDLKLDGGFTRIFSQGANVFINRCIIGGAGHTLRCSGGNIYRNGCLYLSGTGHDGNDNYTRVFCNSGLSRAVWSSGSTTPSGVTLRNNIVFSGAGYGTMAQGGRLFIESGVGFRKLPSGAMFTLTGLASARINGGIWGSGNAASV